MKKNNISKLALFLCMCLIITMPAFAGMEFEATATTDLTMQFVQRPDVDVVLTIGNSDYPVDTFKEDLTARLAELGVESGTVEISSLEVNTTSSNDADAADVFNSWTNYPSDIGQWQFDSVKGEIFSTVNTYWTGYWEENESISDVDFSCDFGQFNDYDNDNIGITFRMNVGANPADLNDYAYYAYVSDANGAIDSGLYKKVFGQSTYGMTKLVSDSHVRARDTWYNLQVKMTGNHIEIYRDGVKVMDYIDSDPLPAGGYGVFTYSQRYGYFKNIGITSKTVFRFSEVIRQPSWRDSAERFVINLDDELIGDFEDEMALSEILYRTLNEDIHYIGWGNNSNADQANAFIADNNGMGAFVNRDTMAYSDAIDQIASYVAAKVDAKTKVSGSFDPANPETAGAFIAGQPISIEVSPADLKSNTVTTEYPNGRWRVDHDPNYYVTPGGTMWWDNTDQDDLPGEYTQPGEYDFYFEDTMVSKLNFHRKPVAKFVFNTSDNTITNLSYDLDGEIVANAWKWKEVTATTSTEVSDRSWILREPTPADFIAGHEYIVQLRVLDQQNVWSGTTSKYISTTNTITSVPIADFEMSPGYLQKHLGTAVAYTNKSYDPQGRSITDSLWTVFGPDGSKVHEAATPLTEFAAKEQGDYTIQLKVENDLGIWSEVYTKSLTVVDDLVDPTIEISETAATVPRNPWEVTLTFADEGGSGFKRQSVTLLNTTTGESTPLGWSSVKSKTISLAEDGVWSITAVAEDQKGNTATKNFSGYRVDATAPSAPSITGAPSGWTSHDVTASIGGSSDASTITYQVAVSAGTPSESDWANGTSKALTSAGEHHVWARAVDAAGNISATTDTWAKIDKTAPVYTTMPANRSMEVDSVYEQDLVEADDPESGIIGEIIIDARAVKTDVVGNYLVIYWIKNGAGTLVPSSQMISVVDTTIPKLHLVGASSVDVEVKTRYTDAGATATDNYDSDAAITAAVKASNNIDLDKVGTYKVTYHVTDVSGNAAEAIQRTVNVEDTTIPKLALIGLPSVDVEVHTSYTDDGATATDNYDGAAAITATIKASDNINIDRVGAYTVTYNVSDANGNVAEAITRTVNVVDTTIPVITVDGENPVDTEVHLPYLDAGASATDNYDAADAITAAIEASNNLDLHRVGAYTVTYTVTDANDNAAVQKTRTVNVVDTTIPVLHLTGDPSVDVEVRTSYADDGATATDNYDAADVITAAIIPSDNIDLDKVGTYKVTYHVTDVSGNAAEAIQRTVNVEDTTIPKLALIGLPSVDVEVHTSYTDDGAKATDNYDGAAAITATIKASDDINIDRVGAYTVTYNVSDANGNVAEAITRTVNVVDTTIPVITVKGENPVDTEVHMAYSDEGASATDNYDSDESITAAIEASNNLDLHRVGAYTVTYIVTDANDNAALQQTRTVNVVDTTVPVLHLTGEPSLDVEVHTSYADDGATATDNYDAADVITAAVKASDNIDLHTVGSYRVTYAVSDAASNAAVSIDRTVNVVDTTVPELFLTGEPEIFMDQGDPYTDAGAIATDNYDSDEAITSAIRLTNPLDANTLGTYILRYDVTDANGNVAEPIERVIHVIHPLAVSTSEAERVGSYEATFVGAIDHYGVKPVLEHGFVYDRDANKANLADAEGVLQLGALGEAVGFKAKEDLNPGTVYYVRAYAVKSEGFVYGEAVEVKTAAKPAKPVSYQTFGNTSIATVNPDRLAGQIQSDEAGVTSLPVICESEARNQQIQIPLSAIDQINAVAARDGGEPQVQIGTPIGTMELPTGDLGSSDLIPEEFAGDLASARLHVTIEKIDSDTVKVMEEATGVIGIVEPIRFDLTLKANYSVDERTTRVETTPIDAFENLVVRSISAPQTTNPLMVVVYDEETKAWVPVLSRTIVDADGNQRVEILHREMGVYTLIERTPQTVLGLEGSEAKEAIETLASFGVLPYEKGTNYQPNRGITRAEMAYTMVRLMGITQAQEEAKTYTDLTEVSRYQREIQLATQTGIFTGYEDETFRGGQVITREEMAAVVERAMSYAEMLRDLDPSAATQYQDSDQIDFWSIDAVGYLADAGITDLSSSLKYRPQAQATKADAAMMLANFLKIIGMY